MDIIVASCFIIIVIYDYLKKKYQKKYFVYNLFLLIVYMFFLMLANEMQIFEKYAFVKYLSIFVGLMSLIYSYFLRKTYLTCLVFILVGMLIIVKSVVGY